MHYSQLMGIKENGKPHGSDIAEPLQSRIRVV